MPELQLIAAADRAWALGYRGKLLFDLPADRRRFRNLTMGHTILMGRKTFESLPGRLPGRRHIVLSRDPRFAPPDVEVCRSKAEALALAKAYPAGDVFVIGGAEIYRQFLEECGAALMTQVDAVAPAADCFFPDLGGCPGWRLAEVSAWREERGIRFRFATYEYQQTSKTEH
ncbi:MAG: dihydrofolate reductase [Oscillospiraceae bacterium]|jgi:dihydrofolate reductase|nr:dihydrofolate reductase [Oscillospiraceae bacterium]